MHARSSELSLNERTDSATRLTLRRHQRGWVSMSSSAPIAAATGLRNTAASALRESHQFENILCIRAFSRLYSRRLRLNRLFQYVRVSGGSPK